MKAAYCIAASLLALVAGSAAAQEFTPKAKGQLIVNSRITSVAPDESGDILTAAGVDSGLDVKVSDDTIPSLGFTYFLTDHVAVEAILGTSKHEVRAVGGATDVRVHSTWVLPPVVSVQYHFNPKGRVSPYVGAGLNAMIFHSKKDYNGFKVKLDDGTGYALQAGVDVALKGRWSLNADIKKVYFDTNAKINGGALKSDVTLDPLVVSVGVGYRF
ncbi:outer membrane beta-barrel protein [Asticcacaulis sp. BYS171W]|uniref:Outer membrane beta-barrel protein n=1 Tax=Asticcacaulis aquaticus TaxID=2984212 RepID=A0ABT5HTK7_9CAUL|nr:OmpW family outer membrane protein [Asticcacaulis aquaticus]MDC7683396.1 outer membrane beta-barrel protein [Asticcacaulis aquaticus]